MNGKGARSSRHQRGNAIIVALIALTGLAMLGAVTAGSVQTGLSAANAERAGTIARLAAESGIAAGLQFLRARAYYNGTCFSNSIRKDGAWEESASVEGHDIQPGQAGNLLTAATGAWYSVRFRNNIDDPNYGSQDAEDNNYEDSDCRVTVRVDGYGPEGARIALEVDVQGDPSGPRDPSIGDAIGPVTGPLDKLTIVGWRELTDIDF